VKCCSFLLIDDTNLISVIKIIHEGSQETSSDCPLALGGPGCLRLDIC